MFKPLVVDVFLAGDTGRYIVLGDIGTGMNGCAGSLVPSYLSSTCQVIACNICVKFKRRITSWVVIIRTRFSTIHLDRLTLGLYIYM